jgi:hypothetical protein
MQLMNDQQTSHPYYWAGFAIIGDGGQALLQAAPAAPAVPATTTATAPQAGGIAGHAGR